jgi:hypothetical protein
MNAYTETEVIKLLQKFTKDCIHGGDFDQGQSLSDTLSVTNKWIDENIKGGMK